MTTSSDTSRSGDSVELSRAAGQAAAGSSLAPVFPLGAPVSRPWREGVVTRVNELETLLRWLEQRKDVPTSSAFSAAISQHLAIARTAAADRHPWRSVIGATLGRAASNIDAAEASLLRLAPADYLVGQLPGLVAHVRRELASTDPRRVSVETLAVSVSSTRRRRSILPTRGASAPEVTEEQRTPSSEPCGPPARSASENSSVPAASGTSWR